MSENNNEFMNCGSEPDFYIPGEDPELDKKLEEKMRKELSEEQGISEESLAFEEINKKKNKKSRADKKLERDLKKIRKMHNRYTSPRRGFRMSPLKLILCLVILVLIGKSAYKTGKQYFEINRMENQFEEIGIPFDEDAYYDNLKSEASDIDGMSKYDKYEMGLMVADGSDSDYDGLTDKEEIEKYHTDPLKASTAGDLYSDGYKIAHDMDVSLVYEYEGEMEYKNNQCPEVILNASSPLDFNAVVEDQTDRYSLDEFGIYDICKGYFIYNYGSELQIDISDLFDQKIEKSDLKVYVVDGAFVAADLSEPESVDFEYKHKIITVDYEFKHGSQYYVYITKKPSLKSTVTYWMNRSKIKANANLQIDKENDGTGSVLIYGSPFLEQAFGISGHIYYCESDKDELLENAVKFNNDKVLCSEISASDTKKVVAVEKSDLKAKVSSIKNSFLANCLWDGKSKGHWYYLFFIAYEYSEDETSAEDYQVADTDDAYNGDKTDRQHYNNYHTDFDPYVDELPFQNFGSEYSEGGNCAGITHLTSYLFNQGTFPSAGSYDNIKWDISQDKANKTLTDRGLFDYKTYAFIDDNSDKSSNYLNDEYLSAGEMEFVKMIGASWQEANDKVNMNQYVFENGQTIDYSIVDAITGYLDQGKVVEVGLYLKMGSAHAIILYDYYYNDAGEILFRVYDPNIPQNDIQGVKLNCDGACYLQCKKLIGEDGREIFSYLYYPIAEMPNYIATSYTTLMERNGFVAWDENWNTFN